MATAKEDKCLHRLSDRELQQRFREALREVDEYTLKLEQTSDLLELLEAELIKRSLGEWTGLRIYSC